MSRVIAWFARNGVAANLLMGMIIVGGLFTLTDLKKEVFPEFSSGIITVAVPYLGAAPEEVEEGVCVRIEEAVADSEGIKRITSSAMEGRGTVTLELLPGTDARRVLDDVRSRVDAIDTFPEEAEQPVIQEITLRRQVINVAVSGDTDEATLKRMGERVRDELSALPSVSQVELSSARPYEISIEVSEGALRRHGLTFDDVARAVRRSSLDLPGGSIKTEGGEILLRSKGQAYRGREFEKIALLTRPDGTRLLLGDVANVVDGFAETDQSARFDGKPAVVVQVFRVGNESALDIADKVLEYVEEARTRMPEGIALTTWQSFADYLRSRMDLLLRNGRTGLVLVFIVLALFLQFRLAFWVTLGIPISFLGAIWLMPGLGASINLISLFAFILVLGIVVDDAIIVGENVFTHQQGGGEYLEGSISGTQEIATPVIFAVLTSVAAFVPLLTVPGTTGKVMKLIPLIVIPCFLFSLVESLLVLPSHLSHKRRHPSTSRGESQKSTPLRRVARGWGRVQGKFASGMEWFIKKVYRRQLEAALHWRYLTVATALAALMLTAGMVRGGWVRFVFFPSIESDYVSAFLTMPQGTPAEVTAETIARIEREALGLRDELEARAGGGNAGKIFRHAMTSVGEQPQRAAQRHNAGHGLAGGFSGAHLGEVTIELSSSELRSVTSEEIVKLWRDRVGVIPDAAEMAYTASLFSPGEAVNVQLTGADFELLRRAAAELKARLADYPGVFDITDSFRSGKREIKLDIKPAAESVGLTLSDLARQVRQAFYGEEAQRIQRGRDDVRVMVRYPEGQRRSLGDLENLRIRTPAGGQAPFATVAEAQFGRGYAAIRRVDRARAINVTAEADPSKVNPNDITKNLRESFLPQLKAKYPGLRYTFEGERREQWETIRGLLRGFAIAMFLIYALLAVPLRSYFQPLIIMSAIPFGLIGAVLGHIVLGMDLTILSMFGTVALAGVVVNDNLVLVDYVNRRRRAGAPLLQAVRESGAARFRPILLTSMTTFAGLTPLMLEKSVQAQFLIPMGVSLAFGVIFATSISLLLVPSLYVILEDVKALLVRVTGWRPASQSPP